MKLSDLSRYFGYTPNYFFVTRKMSREKFSYMFSFDDNPKESIIKYIKHVDMLLDYVEDLYYNDIEELGKRLTDIGYVPSVQYPITKAIHFSKNIFKVRDERPLNVRFHLVKNLIKIYEYEQSK